jgi:two-component system sensor histidine kinase DesK
MIVGLVELVFFGMIYLHSFFRVKWRFIGVVVLLALIGYFACRYDADYFYMGFYTTAIAGKMTDKRKIIASLMMLVLVFCLVIWHYNLINELEGFFQLFPAMVVMLLLPFAMRIGARTRELKEELNMANEEIAHLSKNEERQRISRDLHDTLGHTLSLITLKSELAEKLMIKSPERAMQEVKDIQATSRAALKQLRELVSGMNAVTIRDEITHAKQILAAAGMVLEVKGDVNKGELAPLVDNIMGMCLREAVTNVVKHSGATQCKIEWSGDGGSYVLKVADQGIGVDIESCNGDVSKNGLNGMRERLNLVDGELQFESGKNKGTSVTFKVPYVNRAIEAGGSIR